MEVWSTEARVAVATGFRRLSLLPTPGGAVLVVDSTGAGGYGLLVLGELRPQADGSVTAYDPRGVQTGAGSTTQMARLLFDAHPARRGLLDCGVESGSAHDGGPGPSILIDAAAIETC